MKAQAIIIENQEEIDQSIKLNLKQPELRLGTVDLYFSLHSISSAFVTRDNYLKVIIAGVSFFLVNETHINKKILTYLETI